jgi:hypothetical protein
MRYFYPYSTADGLFVGNSAHGPASLLLPELPAGFAYMVSVDAIDILSKRVDISVQPPPVPVPEPGIPMAPPDPWYPPVIDYQPPAPADDALQTWAWNATTKRWVSSPTVESFRRVKLAELKAAALAASESDITVQSVTFAADAATRAELAQELALFQAEGAGYSCDWQRADGTQITLTGAQVKGLLRAISTRLAGIRTRFRARRDSVAAATTQAAVEAIVW